MGSTPTVCNLPTPTTVTPSHIQQPANKSILVSLLIFLVIHKIHQILFHNEQAHLAISDTEKKKICSVMDCQKLSREACAHAAQNDRLPVETVVQVLYYEQQRLREALEGTTLTGAESPAVTTKVEVYSTDIHPIPCELSSLERENQDLKLELLKMKMKLKEREKSKDKPVAISSPLVTAENPRLHRKSFISSVSKRIGRLYPFGRDGITPPSPTTKAGSNKVHRDRRYSIS